MPEPYFKMDAGNRLAPGGVKVILSDDPLNPGDLMLTVESGTAVRARMDEQKAIRLATALIAWYHAEAILNEEEADAVNTHQGDTITQYRDGQVYSFTTPTEV